MTERKLIKKKPGFAKIALIYGLILIAIFAIALGVFYVFISRYENSRPNTAVNRYMEALDNETMTEISGEFLETLDEGIQNREEAFDYIISAVKNASMYKNSSASDENSMVFTMNYDRKSFGEVTLKAQKKDIFGLTPWEVEKADFDFGVLGSTGSVTVPKGYRVECNGAFLDPSYVTDNNVNYDFLSDFYGGEVEMPTLDRYEFGPLVGEPVLKVFDESGYELKAQEMNEDFYTDNCNMDEILKIRDFAERYIRLYVKYSSAVDKNNSVNYGRLVSLMVPGTELVSRMVQAIEGLGWASSRDDRLESVEVNRCMNIGNGNYVCDVTYIVSTLGQSSDYVTTTNNVRIVLVDGESGLLAAAMTSY